MDEPVKTRFILKDMPEEDRPQEKLLKLGAEALSNAELLALIIRTGSANKTVVELAQEVLNLSSRPDAEGRERHGLFALRDITLPELLRVKGIGLSKACMIKAAVSLGDRMAHESIFTKAQITSPKDIARYVRHDMSALKVEEFRIAILNTKKELELLKTISKGSLDCTVVHPREVFQAAVAHGAHTIILLHNHPSADPTPSREDRILTRRMVECGKLLGIEVVDHVIIAGGSYYSFSEHGDL
ncbi:DNA repair protein RadC [Peptoniphilus equinus]|uniref:DNA repair protein RadC n=1 Tax=Peptoniphilus equinus TaxID=3016343 RepID=A0ABY7QV18_9FIRM|nr:DNA repair protein RadC [Peptoniphilus equinus]WBW50562.1 DNA repair protein RadC [Peptoniphilus equinus]